MVGATHYLKNAVTKAVVAYLTRVFERLTFLSESKILETFTEVIKSLSSSTGTKGSIHSTEIYLTYLNLQWNYLEFPKDDLLKMSLQSLLKSERRCSEFCDVKNLLQIQHLIGNNSDVNILFFLVVGDENKAQVF